MKIRYDNYNLGYKIVSFAFDEEARDKLISQELSVIFLDRNVKNLVLLPDNVVLSDLPSDIEIASLYNNYDVLEISDRGFLSRKYNDSTDDNYLFITGKCNSNCIMCPSPELSRKNSKTTPVAELMQIVKHIPSDTPHLTVTGGEPFLMGKDIFELFRFAKEKFVDTEFLLLTNGRAFAINEYLQKFCETSPERMVVAIPVHGSCQEIHDAISRANGSFYQTVTGIKGLISKGFSVEIRLVVNKLNVNDFNNISDLIIRELKGISYVSVIAMEMTGTARTNLEDVWIPYKKSFSIIKSSVRKLIENGVDVRLYNFPLCTVERPFWTLCEKSISENKVRFAECCSSCNYKNACGGVFVGTLQLVEDELEAII